MASTFDETNSIVVKMPILVIESPVGIGSEEIVSDFGQCLICDHRQSRLQSVVNLDLAFLSVQLNATSAKNERSNTQSNVIL